MAEIGLETKKRAEVIHPGMILAVVGKITLAVTELIHHTGVTAVMITMTVAGITIKDKIPMMEMSVITNGLTQMTGAEVTTRETTPVVGLEATVKETAQMTRAEEERV